MAEEFIVAENDYIDFQVSDSDSFVFDFGGTAGEYTGVTTVTPDSSTQTLPTAGKVVNQNITVNPIPSNYGLITWNGSVLTVS